MNTTKQVQGNSSNADVRRQTNEYAKGFKIKRDELERINDVYKGQKEKLKESNEKQLAELRDKNTLDRQAETQRQQKILEDLYANTENVKKELDTERENYQKNINDRISNINDDFKNTYTQKTQDNSLKLEELQDKNTYTTQDIVRKNKGSQEKLIYENQIERDVLKRDQTDSVLAQKKTFERNNESLRTQANSNLQKQRIDFAIEMDARAQEHDKKMIEQDIVFKNKENRQEHDHTETMKTTRDLFNKRYKSLLDEHNKMINTLATDAKKHIDSIKRQVAQEKTNIASKSDDPFYRIDTLNPSIRNEEKHYIVSLEVPEHEKNLVTLSGQGRELKLSISRKFADKYEDPQTGQINSSSRAETMKKIFHVDELIDSKRLSSAYENGRLTFIVPKL